MAAQVATKKPVLWRGIRQIGLMWSERVGQIIANPAMNQPTTANTLRLRNMSLGELCPEHRPYFENM